MKVIYKYSLPVVEKHQIELPQGAEIVRVCDVDGLFYLWALVDTEAPIEIRSLEFYKTGQEVNEPTSNLEFLGVCRLFIMQELALYVFERTI